MHPSGSLIKTACETVRLLLNEATADAKYDDALITRTVLSHALSTLVSRASQGQDNPLFVRMQLDLVSNQEYYQLPPDVLQVFRLVKFNEAGQMEWDWRPRNEFHPLGPGWSLDGNTLRINPYPVVDDSLQVWYLPAGRFNIHYGESGVAPGLTNVTTFTMQATPTLGLLGRQESEYAGGILRVMDDGSTGVTYERVISSYDVATRRATIRLPIPLLTKTTLKYEVVPAGSGPFWEAAASHAAIRLGTGRKITQQQMADLVRQHGADMKTLRDTLMQMQGRVSKHIERNTIDHPEATVSYDRDLGPYPR